MEEYVQKYGLIPEEKEDILSYLENALNLKEKDFEKIRQEEEYVNSIPWEDLTIILPIIPKPCPRPRYSSATGSFYVTGAGENKKLLKYFIGTAHSIIYTKTRFHVDTYQPTPLSQMTRTEIYRAEKGSIEPTANPDWDNLGKTYSDMVQEILMLNDNIISKGRVEKFYSVKPRVVINISYQKGFDSKYNKRRITSSIAYKKMVELGAPIEVYSREGDLW